MRNYIKISKTCGEKEDFDALAQEHAEYIRSLKVQGVLSRHGPLSDFSGMVEVFELPGLEAAKSVAASDPFVREGLVTYELIEFVNTMAS